jgi:pyruvate/2-oxoglutarate/acetoin dehydrogenase E1 component
VVAPAALSRQDGSGAPGDLLYHLIVKSEDPTLFIENKLQYLLPVQNQLDLKDFALTHDQAYSGFSFPSYTLSVRGAPPAKLTIAAYGYMAELAKQAVVRLAYEHEIFAELVIPTQLSPFNIDPIISSVSNTGVLLTVEEGTYTLGWGTEVIARVAEALETHTTKYKRLAAKEVPIPASGALEAQVLPGVDQIIKSAIQLQQ